jgi:hypothetical protein
MRRKVGVKWVLWVFCWTRFFSRRVATVATLPSALSLSDDSLGATWAFLFSAGAVAQMQRRNLLKGTGSLCSDGELPGWRNRRRPSSEATGCAESRLKHTAGIIFAATILTM